MGYWPEEGPFPEEKRGDTFRRLLAEWAAITTLAALFFILVPLAVAPSGARPPIIVAILFPAIVFGLASIVRFFIERG
jgi:L-asparagine transporter-like permease